MTEITKLTTNATDSEIPDIDKITEHVTNSGLTITESDGKTTATDVNGTVRSVDGLFLDTVKAVAHLLGL